MGRSVIPGNQAAAQWQGAGVRKIVEKALQKDPYLRYADAGEMRQALLGANQVAMAQ